MRGSFFNKSTHRNEHKFHIRYLRKENIHFFFSAVSKYRKELLLAALFTFLHSFTVLIPPYLTQRVVDDYILPGNPEGMIFLMSVFFTLYGASWYFAYQQRIWSQAAGQRAVFTIRNELHKKIVSLPLRFHEYHKKGTLSSLLMNDVSSISKAITEGIIGLMSDLLILLGITLMMYRMQPQLTMLLLATLPLILITMALLGRRIREAFTEVREKTADLNAQVEENFSGIRVIQSLGIQEKSEEYFDQISQKSVHANVKAMVLLALFFPIMSLTTGFGNAILLWYGGIQVQTSGITLGIFVAFLAYIRKFYMPMRNLSDLYNIYLSAFASLHRIVDVMSIESEEARLLKLNPESVQLNSNLFQFQITFKHLYFSYDTEPVLKGLHLDIKKGERIGIVGESGTGKSSLIRLLTALDNPLQGEILLDDQRISTIPLSFLRKKIAVVPQTTFLFSDTIANNIRQGNPKASLCQVQQASKKAKAHDMIMRLPNQYETILGEGGVGLSGGQRQLISFARALLKEPEVLILDEATSSMDIFLEDLLLQSIDDIIGSKTAIIISHRIRTIQNLDRICILRNGQIEACGTHAELLNHHDYYKTLVTAGQNKVS